MTRMSRIDTDRAVDVHGSAPLRLLQGGTAGTTMRRMNRMRRIRSPENENPSHPNRVRGVLILSGADPSHPSSSASWSFRPFRLLNRPRSVPHGDRLVGKVDSEVDFAPALAAAAKARRNRLGDGKRRLAPPLCAHVKQIRPR